MFDSLLLVVIAFISSTMTAVLGLGGGLLLISIMANILPPLAVIPIHGVVQLSSNASRAFFSFRDIVFEIVPAFLVGTLLGSTLAFPLMKHFDSQFLPLPLAFFILFMTWGPSFKNYNLPISPIFSLGALQGFLSMFVGATGPLTPPILMRKGLDGRQVIATHALMMMAVHVLKIIFFGFLGFSFVEYLPLLTWMILAVIAGSWIGTKLRRRIADENIKTILKVVVTFFAIRMIMMSV